MLEENDAELSRVMVEPGFSGSPAPMRRRRRANRDGAWCGGFRCAQEDAGMRFTYPARLRPDATGELIVSFRDLPECLTSGAGEAEALAEAADALEEAIAGRIDCCDIPVPSARRSGERHVPVPAATAAKAALALALRDRGLSRAVLARHLGVDENTIGRMLDPRHRTALDRIESALRVLGHELVVETRPAG